MLMETLDILLEMGVSGFLEVPAVVDTSLLSFSSVLASSSSPLRSSDQSYRFFLCRSLISFYSFWPLFLLHLILIILVDNHKEREESTQSKEIFGLAPYNTLVGVGVVVSICLRHGWRVNRRWKLPWHWDDIL